MVACISNHAIHLSIEHATMLHTLITLYWRSSTFLTQITVTTGELYTQLCIVMHYFVRCTRVSRAPSIPNFHASMHTYAYQWTPLLYTRVSDSLRIVYFDTRTQTWNPWTPYFIHFTWSCCCSHCWCFSELILSEYEVLLNTYWMGHGSRTTNRS